MKSNATKAALSEAFKQHLTKKPIAKITINDITEQCGISRMTFYYHFKDIYDLAEWTIEDALRPAIGDHRTYDNWQQGFLNLLNVLRENKGLIMNVYHSVDREMIERYMLKQVEALLLGVVEEEAEGIILSPDGKRRVAVFYTYAFLGTVLEWIRLNMAASPQTVVEITAAILHGDFKNSLENMSELERKIK